jgi:SSS family solute:Na+ symporter
LAIFLLGFYWKRTNSSAALAGALLTIPISTVLKFLPQWTNNAFPIFPFLDRMSITFGLIVVVMIAISLSHSKNENNNNAIEVDTAMFKVTPGFLISSIVITGILAALYTVFW